MTTTNCYCGSGQAFENCCRPYIIGERKPLTAEALMRSRYSGYASGAINYIINTTAFSERKYYLAPFTFAKSHWKVWKFYGPVPYSYHFSETTIMQRT